MKILTGFTAFILFSLSPAAQAAEEFFFSSTEAGSSSASSIITFGYVIQLFFSLLIVFGLIYLTSKYILPRFKMEAKGKIIEVLDRIVLEPQVSSYIIKVGRQKYLLGVSNKNVTLIDTLESLE